MNNVSQDIIRASVNQEPSSTQPMAPTWAIKLPTQREESVENSSFPSAGGGEHENESSEEEDDDWDTFQSFPLPVNEDASPSCITEMPNLTEELSVSDYKAKNSDIEGQSSLQPSGEVNKITVAGEVNTEMDVMLVSEANVNQTEVYHSENGCCSTDQQDNLQEESNVVMPSSREVQTLKHDSEYHYSNPAQRDGPGLDNNKVTSAAAEIQTPIVGVEVAAVDHESSECISTDQQDDLQEKNNQALSVNTLTGSPTEHAEKEHGSCEGQEIKMESNSENDQCLEDVQIVEQSDSGHGNHPENGVESHPPSEQESSNPESAHPPEHSDDDHQVTQSKTHDHASSGSMHEEQEQRTNRVNE